MKVSIRGIYSTALIGLLQEKGFTIVNPTKSQVERFGITMKNEPDVMIVDSPSDRNCIEIRGSAEVVQELVKTLQSFFEDLVVLHLSVCEPLGRAKVGFPNQAKLKLDELRSRVSYTVPYHHYCRAGGEGLSSMVSFAEDLVERGLVPAEEMSRMFREQVDGITPRLGTMIKIIHIKPNGKRLSLGLGKVIWRGDGKARIQRRIMGFGVYDGLGVEKSPGDYAITEVTRFQPWMKTSYYSISGELKGRYYNISTPISLYPDHVHYFDLEIDVVVKPNSEAEIVDIELLEKALEEGRIREEVKIKALKIAEEIASKQP
ncbi:MAG: hypothetical protein DRN47_01170 [Candidatus Wolframiiraptor sp.]|nr:MAG: hypothetical protein DRN47_01170 [Candidatus Wolframiiraptor sp.]